MTDSPYLLGKLGDRVYMQALAEKGIVFMQRLCSYKSLEDSVRGDKNEALEMRFDAKNPTLKLKVTVGTKVIYPKFKSLVVHSPERDHGVYCMSRFEVPDGSGLPTAAVLPFVTDRRFRTFGDTLVIFRNTTEFVRRLHEAAARAGFSLDQGPIEYVPEDYCGEVGPFRKLESYRYQSEHRFVTTTALPAPNVTLTLGPLLDIARWIDLNGPGEAESQIGECYEEG